MSAATEGPRPKKESPKLHSHVFVLLTAPRVADLGRIRSKTGCLCCRKRKKKCDEIHPTCGLCRSRNEECVWTIHVFNPQRRAFDEHRINKNTAPKSRATVLALEILLETLKNATSVLKVQDSPLVFLEVPAAGLSHGPLVPQIKLLLVSSSKSSKTGFKAFMGQEDDEKVAFPHSEDEPHLPDVVTESSIFGEDKEVSTPENIEDHLATEPSMETSLSPFLQLRPFSPFLDFLGDHGETEDTETTEKKALELTLLDEPTPVLNMYLDAGGLRLLGFYELNVTRILCISPDLSNYFLKTFFNLANYEESILHALAAWGGIFLENLTDQVRYHKDRASMVIHQHYISKKRLDKYDYFVILCYYLITIGSEICAGDTHNWYSLFVNALNLLRRYGLVQKFLLDFDYSNDVKWLISSFQFHDIMSLVTLRQGTTCEISLYIDLFAGDSVNYGIDPYQGCMQPLYLLLGEIMNTSVEFKSARETLQKKMDKVHHQLLAEEDTILELRAQRIAHYRKVVQKASELESRISLCQPNAQQLAMLPQNEVQHHLTLFKLYRNTCRLYLKLYIQQTQPQLSEVQHVLVESFALIDEIAELPLKGSLPMALLICGISCCTELDRVEMKNKFNRLFSVYRVGNVRRVWDVIEETWRLNPKGSVCIDWVAVCEDFGWKLSVC